MNPQQANLFSGNARGENMEDKMESKFQTRDDAFISESNMNNLTQDALKHELNLGNDARSRLFKDRRLKQRIALKTSQTLESKLTIPKELYENCQKMEVRPDMLQSIIQEFNTQEINTKYKGLVGVRKLLSLPTNPPIQEIIDLGLVSQLVGLLGASYPEFEYESLWCLTNIACGTSDQASSILSKGGLEKIMKLMDSPVNEVQEQATWTLGNLVGDSAKARDAVVAQGGFQKIISVLSTANRQNLVKQCIWSISNFCRMKPVLSYDIINRSFDYIIRSINLFFDDNELIVDATWILSAMSEAYKKCVKAIIESGILPKILECLKKDNQLIILSCLRIIGNIAAGDANQTQLLLDNGILNYLKETIYNKKKSIRKETAWIISNIAAGTQRQIESLIQAEYLPMLTKIMQNDATEIQKECIWAICNLTSIEKDEYMEMLFKQGIAESVCNCLKSKEAKHLAVGLEALSNLLAYGVKISHGQGENPVVAKIEQLGMFDVLENLQYHPVEIVYEKVIKILETYFETENVV
ncbi:MAG: hypothetical protein MJ252_14040 [archaeon]|nr:hypothetical protein [archaeon]